MNQQEESLGGHPTIQGATKWQIAKGRLRLALGIVLNKLRAPGAIREVSHYDPVVESLIEVSVGPLFTRISVNGRDYYFDRVTGCFGGTGRGICHF